MGGAWRSFLREEAGAITVDWVALTAGTSLLGIAVVFSVFSSGVSPLVAAINDELPEAGMCDEFMSKFSDHVSIPQHVCAKHAD